jgi:hypothetical protein
MNEHIQKILDHPKRDHTIIGVVCTIGGAVGGYFYAKKTLDRTYRVTQLIETDIHGEVPGQLDMDSVNIEELREALRIAEDRVGPVIIDADSYESITEDGSLEVMEKETHISTEIEGNDVEVAQRILQVVEEAPTDEELVVTHNIFGNDDEFDLEEEIKKRTPGMPYVLHRDEFYADEEDFSQSTLTYYSGDDILVDENDVPVYNHNRVIGDLRFGHGSNDPNVFYVRNHNLRAEYEVVLADGHYAKEVLGLDIEDNARTKDMKHSLHRFRDD